MAAFVVLTFAFVAALIPIKPAKAEQIAPTINDTATIPFEPSSFTPLKYNRIATPTTKIESTLYSAFKNDIAPSEMCFAILVIFSFPSSCFDTHLFFRYTNKSAKTPNKGK